MTPLEALDPETAQFVQEALDCVDANDAGHWPTVAGYLALEVRRLRAALSPRVVTTPEELDALPAGTVVLSAVGDPAEAQDWRWGHRTVRRWLTIGNDLDVTSATLATDSPGWTVVWTPPQADPTPTPTPPTLGA